ncbi:MAG: PilZ domain-containing protein [Armatimonadetes bacterium]|nr:PilZ domain-containing protein [Armatimonadota bacterium]
MALSTLQNLLHRANRKTRTAHFRGWDQRRCGRRVALICPTWYRRERGRYNKTCAIDISCSGARVMADGGLRAGHQLELVFKTGESGFVNVRARVVWTRRIRGSVRQQVGLRFSGASDRLLRKWIDSLSMN